MSRQVRQRVTAIVLGGLIFGAPMLANGTASAGPISEGTRQVTFSGGGMFSISCRSQPSVESMTVPAQSTIRVVNETGFAATLLLGGEEKGKLPDNGSTEVVFRRGTTPVVVEPNCAIGEDAMPVLITASPSALAVTLPDPGPVPTVANATPMSLAPADTDDAPGASTDSSAPGTALPAERPSRLQPADSRPDTRRQHRRHDPVTDDATQMADTAVQAMPHGGAAPPPKIKTKTKAAPGTPMSTEPEFSGMPPGDEKALLAGVPSVDLEPVTIGAEPVASASPPAEIAAAEPVSALEPMREGEPVGLLALIAAVSVVGVTIAAIRSIVSQRANRAQVA